MVSDRTKAEMARGAQIVQENTERQALPHALNILSRALNPNHVEKGTPPPPGYATWTEFHNRLQVQYLPNERDGTPKGGNSGT